MKQRRSQYYLAWREWRNPRRYGVECHAILMREIAKHLSRELGPLRTFEDADRVRLEGEASYAAAVARAREQMAALLPMVSRRAKR